MQVHALLPTPQAGLKVATVPSAQTFVVPQQTQPAAGSQPGPHCWTVCCVGASVGAGWQIASFQHT